MDGIFNAQIFIDKLAKLSNSQQSIETLSHWCIFHRKKAKQVVETWDRQFYCSPRDRQVSFLYLANDILQNSRRKGSEFVDEFWKVLPDALSDVLDNGDEFGKNAALRLVDIWEDRKVFGSCGQFLKEQLLGRNLENKNKAGKNSILKLKQSVGETLEKIVSSYEIVYDGYMDEDDILAKCRSAISSVEKADKEISGNNSSGNFIGSELVMELQGQHGVLRECIAQMKSAEASRANLVSNLREALQEQELKLHQLRNQLQVAQTRSEQTGNICQQLVNNGRQEQRLKEATTLSDTLRSINGPGSPVGSREGAQSAPLVYTQGPADNLPLNEEEHRKMTAAMVATKLAASASSAEMLSLVLSSLASEGIIGSTLCKSSINHPPDKRPRLVEGPYILPLLSPPPFQHPDSHQCKNSSASQQMSLLQPSPPHMSSLPLSHPAATMQPSPSLLPVPQPRLLPAASQFMQTAGSMTSVPYSYGTAPQQSSMPDHPLVGNPVSDGPSYPLPPNPYQNFQASDGGFCSWPSLSATPSQH